MRSSAKGKLTPREVAVRKEKKKKKNEVVPFGLFTV
jgi:hypothetical protein